MLAKIGEPFDHPDWIFEIKWDGTRALTFAEGGDYRLLNRKANPQRDRYPELETLRGLPDGTILDGEIAILVDGKPSFHGMLKREQVRHESRARQLAATLPAVYVVFDYLYRAGEPLFEWPLIDRRAALQELLESHAEDLGDRILFSQAIPGDGILMFEEACRQELEGIVAKRADSRYLPGKRTEAWQKIKRTQHVFCAILGFLPDGARDLRSLVIAIEVDGQLTYAGRVGSGLDDSLRRSLRTRLDEHVRDDPFLEVPSQGGEEVLWVEPTTFCRVKYLEITPDGQLRAPVFVEIVE